MSETKRRKASGKIGRPAPIAVTMNAAELADLDAWIATLSDPKPTRAEAIKQAMKAMLHVIEQNRAEQVRDARRRLDLDLGAPLRAPRQ